MPEFVFKCVGRKARRVLDGVVFDPPDYGEYERRVYILGYDGIYKLPQRKEDRMIVFKYPSGQKQPMKYLILEKGDSTSRLVIRNAREAGEPYLSLELNYEGALELLAKLDEAIAKMTDDRVVKTDVQVRF